MNNLIRLEVEEIFFPVTRIEKIRMSAAMREFIRSVASPNNKIPSIKFVRAEFNLGLKEAKDIVDAIVDAPTNLGQRLRAP